MAKLLIVEDVDEMRCFLRELIKTHLPGTHITGAANTVSARQHVTRDRPDLILLDEILPGESAYDFLAEMIEDGLKILLITSHVGASRPLNGALGRVQKPALEDRNFDVFINAIRNALSA